MAYGLGKKPRGSRLVTLLGMRPWKGILLEIKLAADIEAADALR
jgi:hypothetical protein